MKPRTPSPRLKPISVQQKLVTYQGEYHGESEEGPLLGLPEAQPANVPVGRLHVRVGERRVVRAPRGPVAGPGQLQLGRVQLEGIWEHIIKIEIISPV